MSARVVDGLRIVETSIPGVRVVEPQVFGDARGSLVELWNVSRWRDAGLPTTAVQDNLAVSTRGVLRGLHFQQPYPQGKVVTVADGEIFDVAVDIRVGSPTFGRWAAAMLSSANRHALVIPAGFAHGFLVTSDRAVVLYKFTELYHPEAESGVAWDDPDIGIEWPLHGMPPVVSNKDKHRPRLCDADRTRLPTYEPR